MMIITHYFDIKAIPQEDMTEDLIIDELLGSLHNLLVRTELKGKIGLGFPNFNLNKRLGGILRLFSSEEYLLEFEKAVKIDNTIRDYAVITENKRVPDRIKGHTVFSRIRPREISQSQIKRYQKRNPDKWTEAFAQEVNNNRLMTFGAPHFKIRSASTKQHFTIWVKRKEQEESFGLFDSYGLSKGASVPHF